jgi:acyl-CoA thioesterase I
MTPRFAPAIGLAAIAAVSTVPERAHAATIVALGASHTYGKGVSRTEAYPAQLEALLRARGLDVRVINAGINGDTTGSMISRVDRAVPNGTAMVILQPGGNDQRKGASGDRTENIAAIQSRLNGRGIKVVMLENSMFRGLPKQPDGQHLTPQGYRMLAETLLPQVAGALGR